MVSEAKLLIYWKEVSNFSDKGYIYIYFFKYDLDYEFCNLNNSVN